MMQNLPHTAGLAAALALATALAGCDKPKDRTPPPAEAGAPLTVPVTPAGDPMPALPAWSGDYVGKALASVYSGEVKICKGNTDNVQTRYGGAAPGVQIVGWGWDSAAKTPIARVLLADSEGMIVGAGESGLPRPDVTTAVPEATSPNTGWAAYTARTTGPINSYGLIDGGKVLCALGRLEF